MNHKADPHRSPWVLRASRPAHGVAAVRHGVRRSPRHHHARRWTADCGRHRPGVMGQHAVLRRRVRARRVLPVMLLLPRSVRPRAMPVHGARPVNARTSTSVRRRPELLRLLCGSLAGAGILSRAPDRCSHQLCGGLLLLLLTSRLLLWALPISVWRPGLCAVRRRLRRTVHSRGLLLLLMTATDVDSGRPERHGQLGTASRQRGLVVLLLLTGHVVAIRHRLGRQRLCLLALMTVLLVLILLLLLRLVVLLMVHVLPLLRMLGFARLCRQRMAAPHPLGLGLLLRRLLRPVRSSHRLCSMWGRSRLLVFIHSALQDWSVHVQRRGWLVRLHVCHRCLRICTADGAVGQGDRLRHTRLAVGCLRVTQQHPLKHIVAGLLSCRSLAAGARGGPVSRRSPHKSDGHDRRSP